MARTRKLTFSVKEFGRLVSESFDNTDPSSQSFVDNTAVFSHVSRKPHNRQSSFQRIFSRASPGRHEDSTEVAPEDLSDTPRKMITWPFSRSARKHQSIGGESNATDSDVDRASASPYSATSLAAASTSSLGSLLPVAERLFPLPPSSSHDQNRDCNLFRVATSAPSAVSPAHTSEPPSNSDLDTATATLGETFSNGSATSVVAGSNRSVVEPASDISNQSWTSFDGTEALHPVASNEPERTDEDPTLRTSTFGLCAAFPSREIRDDPVLVQSLRSQRLPHVVPSQNIDIFALRPAVGVVPYVPSETESSASQCSTSSIASPVARTSSPTFQTAPSGSRTPSSCAPPVVPPNPRSAAIFPDIPSSSNTESVPTLGPSPRQRKPAISRSLSPPQMSRPPPTGPLPAVPSSVPPALALLPPQLKISPNVISHSVQSPTPRSTVVGAPTNPPTALPPSPPGGLRLPSRLSWVSSVRAVLPSPPASPTRSLKSLTGKPSPTSSPSKAEKAPPILLKRPTSIGVIEAADNVQVRRTKSILLLGSGSKSNTSLGTKRVQIHADADSDASESRKPKRKSSAPAVSYPTCSSDVGPMITPTPSSELLVPRERRHSSPMLSSMDPGVSADWTLSLPFCIDLPGNKIPLSPLLPPPVQLETDEEEDQGEDWTLCMPLKVRVDTSTVESIEEPDSESTPAKVPEGPETRAAMQLPTPCPSPTWSSPSSVTRPLDPEEDKPVDRPASPASLGPHAGGLDLARGCGKRASGWHVYGWFDEVNAPEDNRDVASTRPERTGSDSKLVRNHVTEFRQAYDGNGRQTSRDSASTMSTSEATFYSARSSLVN